MAQKVWKICGFDGLKAVFERTIPYGSLSDQEITELLKRLESRHLRDDEVIDASLRKNAKGHTSYLEVRPNRGGTPGLMTTGTGHHYIAVVEDVK